ncbi:MAG: 16S rRNA (uracil(1498)-N(3))-methyltransferase [Proteobacteria bacterium]|nr:16S rRNA (uracil(1498)-N(3))-methyltransferase [Pseudomonadota bacterium]
MSEIRLFIDYAKVSKGNIIELSKGDKKYLFNVLRRLPDDIIFILDGKGKSFKAKIIDKNHIKIIDEEENIKESHLDLILCQALLKGEKMDFVIQKSTELGVKKIIPFISERCVLKSTNKIERWRRIAKESSEQCGRLVVPEIDSLENFDELISYIDNGLLFWEKAESPLIDAFLSLNISKPLFLIVGPEGGFSLKEVNNALGKGIKIASLGRRILRADTAAIFSLSVVSFLLQNYDIIEVSENDIKGKSFKDS